MGYSLGDLDKCSMYDVQLYIEAFRDKHGLEEPASESDLDDLYSKIKPEHLK